MSFGEIDSTNRESTGSKHKRKRVTTGVYVKGAKHVMRRKRGKFSKKTVVMK